MTLETNIKDTEVIATLDGRLDTAASSQFAIDMEPLIDNADKKIIMDCTKLSFISSSGLRLFLSLRKATISKGGSVAIKGMNADIKQVFTITGFLNLFEIED